MRSAVFKGATFHSRPIFHQTCVVSVWPSLCLRVVHTSVRRDDPSGRPTNRLSVRLSVCLSAHLSARLLARVSFLRSAERHLLPRLGVKGPSNRARTSTPRDAIRAWRQAVDGAARCCRRRCINCGLSFAVEPSSKDERPHPAAKVQPGEGLLLLLYLEVSLALN